MNIVNNVTGFEILDSRGKPSVMVRCTLNSGASAYASVPSGASTGSMEAHELRDHDLSRFGGNGCLKVVDAINTVINSQLKGKSFNSQQDLDQCLIKLDGTSNKSELGANSILAVSLAYAKAASKSAGKPLFKHLSDESGLEPSIPRPMINLFSGGKHGGKQTSIQDLQLLLPENTSIQSNLKVFYDIYYSAAARMKRNHGLRLLRADEGGLAPPFKNSEAMFQEAVAVVEEAGYIPGKDIFFAVDVAATHFYDGTSYLLDGNKLESEEVINLLSAWREKYPIVSIEDGLAENDWPGWGKLMDKIGQQTMVLGDDLLCTNPSLIRKAIQEQAANSLLLKVNQIGTLTEAFKAYKLAKSQGWSVVFSARSGETEDNWLADLAVGWGGDYIKIGSITQSDRLSKYNRLLVIESEFGQY
ncbi:MAG: enolase [Cyclobacteriaceae bacterium]|nr:MAG: enolase [Cyclobacteriaceae bacterium]